MREDERVSKTDRQHAPQTPRNRWAQRCRETGRHIVFETEARETKGRAD